VSENPGLQPVPASTIPPETASSGLPESLWLICGMQHYLTEGSPIASFRVARQRLPGTVFKAARARTRILDVGRLRYQRGAFKGTRWPNTTDDLAAATQRNTLPGKHLRRQPSRTDRNIIRHAAPLDLPGDPRPGGAGVSSTYIRLEGDHDGLSQRRISPGPQ